MSAIRKAGASFEVRVVPGTPNARWQGFSGDAARKLSDFVMLTTLPEGFLTVPRWSSGGYPPNALTRPGSTHG
jgi:hypothetical protein